MTKARNEYYMFKLVFKARNNQSLKKFPDILHILRRESTLIKNEETAIFASACFNNLTFLRWIVPVHQHWNNKVLT